MTSVKGNIAFQARSLVCPCCQLVELNTMIFHISLHLFLTHANFSLQVSLPPTAVESVCSIQFPRIRQAEDEGRFQGTQRREGREGDTGPHSARIEGATGNEGMHVFVSCLISCFLCLKTNGEHASNSCLGWSIGAV